MMINYIFYIRLNYTFLLKVLIISHFDPQTKTFFTLAINLLIVLNWVQSFSKLLPKYDIWRHVSTISTPYHQNSKPIQTHNSQTKFHPFFPITASTDRQHVHPHKKRSRQSFVPGHRSISQPWKSSKWPATVSWSHVISVTSQGVILRRWFGSQFALCV